MLKLQLAALAALVLAAPAAAVRRSETVLLREMNRVRAGHRLAPLRFDTRLQRAARSHSREMIGSNNGAGHRPRGLASPEHRANLLRPSFTRAGVGDLVGSFQGYSGAHVVTADFAG